MRVNRVGGPGKGIFFYSKVAGYEWLSNFFLCDLVIDGERYRSVEHYYQSRKAITVDSQRMIASAPTPAEAKRLGRTLRPSDVVKGWDSIKVQVMRFALRAKFTQNQDLKRRLLDTGTAGLHEDSPNDRFWGVRGRDMLGRLLMELREELRAQSTTE